MKEHPTDNKRHYKSSFSWVNSHSCTHSHNPFDRLLQPTNPSSTPSSAPSSSNSKAPPLSAPPAGHTHHMVTGIMDGTRNPRVLFFTSYPISECVLSSIFHLPVEPTCFVQARKGTHWQKAMLTEFNSLWKNQTWSLVPYSSSMNAAGFN